jgi:hypothetical protein
MLAMLPVWASWGVMAIAVVYGLRFLLPIIWGAIVRRPAPKHYGHNVLVAVQMFFAAAGLGFLIWVFAVPL